jgi:hypothetical protein
MQLASVKRTDEKTIDAVGVPLTVVFADAEAIAAVRAAGEGFLPIEPPFHMSDEDAYLVLPTDIGLEMIDIVADSDHELLGEALRDGLVVNGFLGREDGTMGLHAEAVETPLALLSRMPYAEALELGRGTDPVAALNALPHAQCTVVSKLVDEEGLSRMLSEDDYLGKSWGGRAEGGALADPTFAWSRRVGPRTFGVELALFTEYEELVALLRPVSITARAER